MNKEKILRLYNDFSHGKFMSEKERTLFNTNLKKLKVFIKENPVKINQNFYFTPDMLESNEHPGICGTLYEYLKTRPEKLNGQTDLLQSVFPYTNYNHAYKNSKILSENIYIITDKIYQTFAQMELPDISFKDIQFKNDLPALFILDTFNTVAYLNYFSVPFDQRVELIINIFGHNQKHRSQSNSFLIYSDNVPTHIDLPIKELVTAGLKEKDNQTKEVISKYMFFFYNLLFFLSQKETIKYHTKEMNDNRLNVEKNITGGVNVKKNKSMLNQLPSYRFVDLEVTLNNYSKEYYLKNPPSESGSVTPHWRSSHWHTYWKGKRDGIEERKKVLKFIPTLWVGNPEMLTEQTSFRVIK